MLPVGSEEREHRLGSWPLILRAVAHMLDSQCLETHPERFRIAPGDDRWRDARHPQKLEAIAVEDAESLERLAMFAEVDAAVGQHAIDVEERDANVLRCQQRF